MGNTPTHPKLFEVDEEIRILQDAVNDAKLRKEQIYQKLLIEHPVFAKKVNQSYYSWAIEWIFGD